MLESRKILKETNATLDAANSQLGINDDSHFEEEENEMVEDHIPVSSNSATVVGDGASGISNAADDEGMTCPSSYISLLST